QRFWFAKTRRSKVIGIVASILSAGIEHPFPSIRSDGVGEKFLNTIAAQREVKRVALFRAHRQELCRRKTIMCPAFETHHHIQSIASVSAGDLLAIQDWHLARKILLGQLNAKMRRQR